MHNNIQSSDIIVILGHPHGDLEVTLNEWILKGPGERDLLRPMAAKNKNTGEQLPLNVIPFVYRNSFLSRALIALKVFSDPWKNDGIAS
jgi:hypothetical protein